jgi:DNA (cytosine-5)-methyltransferase 1
MGLRFGSVCSGIEAASCAWHPLGWKAAFVSEIEAFPRAVLAHHYPDVPLHGDFTTIREGQYEPIELLVGGTPCQSFSVAGLRGGLADDRGNLALEYLRLADRLRPRWLVWENVPGVLSSAGGRDFGSILGGLVELGYGFAYRVLDAQFFGVAQRRRRVFVVGHLGDWRRAAAVLFERHSLQGHPAPRREAGEGTSYSPALRARANSSHRADSQAFIPDISPGLKARDYKGPSSDGACLVAHALRGEGFDASEDGTGRGTPIVPVCFSSKDHGADAEVNLSPTLRAGGHDGSHANAGVPPAIAFGWQNSSSQGDGVPEHVTPSLDKSKTPAVFSIMPQNSGKDYKARQVYVA